jgi:hypothetical protein
MMVTGLAPAPASHRPAANVVAVSVQPELEAECVAALANSDNVERVADLRSAINKWSRRDPAATLDWILASSEGMRGVALSALAGSLATDPAAALAFGQLLFRQQPALADEFGSMLIGELLRAGRFEIALQLAVADPADSRTGWVTRVAVEWAGQDADFARDAATALRTQGITGGIFAGVAQGWAQSAPAQLADYALTLPAGPDREVALRYGIDQLTLRDPASAATRIEQLNDPGDRDPALASYLAHTDPLNRPTSAALAHALNISNPALRADALTRVLREWRATDLVGALTYIETAPALAAGERQQLLSDFTSPQAD